MSDTSKIVVVIALIAAVGVVVFFKACPCRVSREGPPSPAADVSTHPAAAQPSSTAESQPAATPASLPRLVDLGSRGCIPCEMMAPILDQLRKDFAGRLEVTFYDVRERPDIGRDFGIRVIPTQIFFDAAGNELFRHEGFMSKTDILNQWKELGVDLQGSGN